MYAFDLAMPLPTFLQYHVMEGRIAAPTQPESKFTMMNGQDIQVTVEGNKVSVIHYHSMFVTSTHTFSPRYASFSPSWLQKTQTIVHGKHNTSAEIIKSNIHCANGVIHLIDNFLVPDYAEYEPPPYNSSLYYSFYPPMEDLPPSNLPVPDGWYDEDEPSIGGNSLWGSSPTTNTASSTQACASSVGSQGDNAKDSGTTVSAGVNG